ncbi:MAG: hypothetical protein HKN37_16415 [Rhodothermales bacterium]|nr:hypothetical protein [Rhodothermales bacterium]
MRVGALCAGSGALELGLPWEHELVWVSEIDSNASTILEERFGVPNLGDLTEISNPPAVDLITAGWPCQPVSQAGLGKGVNDERWLIDDVLRIAEEAEAQVLIMENVPGIYTANQGEAFRRVVTGLAEGRWLAEWGRFGAFQVGAAHRRNRWFCIAARNTDSLAGAQAITLGHDPAGMLGGGYWQGADAGYSEAPTDTSGSGRTPGTGPQEGTATELGGHGPDDDGREDAAHPDDTGRGEHGGTITDEAEFSAVEHVGDVAADASGEYAERRGGRHPVDGEEEPARQQEEPDQSRHSTSDRSAATPDSNSFGLEGGAEGHGEEGNVDFESRRDPDRRSAVDWGKYTPAIERWEYLIGRPAPNPVSDVGRLSPRFVEWHMGLPDGWVTDIIEKRTHSLRILGNGVVPQQAHHAILQLSERLQTTVVNEPEQMGLF